MLSSISGGYYAVAASFRSTTTQISSISSRGSEASGGTDKVSGFEEAFDLSISQFEFSFSQVSSPGMERFGEDPSRWGGQFGAKSLTSDEQGRVKELRAELDSILGPNHHGRGHAKGGAQGGGPVEAMFDEMMSLMERMNPIELSPEQAEWEEKILGEIDRVVGTEGKELTASEERYLNFLDSELDYLYSAPTGQEDPMEKALEMLFEAMDRLLDKNHAARQGEEQAGGMGGQLPPGMHAQVMSIEAEINMILGHGASPQEAATEVDDEESVVVAEVDEEDAVVDDEQPLINFGDLFGEQTRQQSAVQEILAGA